MKKIVSRIRKLLALSQSPNQNEAALAAQKAADLLSEYNLSLSDIELSELPIVDEEVDVSYLATWRVRLAHVVSRSNYCRLLLLPSCRRLIFVGRDHNAKAAREMFLYLSSSIEENCRAYAKKYRPGRTRLDSFRLGFVRLIQERLESASWGRPENGALVISEDAAIDRELKDRGLKNARTRKSPGVYEDDYILGQMAARNVSLNRQVNREEQRFLK